MVSQRGVIDIIIASTWSYLFFPRELLRDFPMVMIRFAKYIFVRLSGTPRKEKSVSCAMQTSNKISAGLSLVNRN
jgi:hypothetical protein